MVGIIKLTDRRSIERFYNQFGMDVPSDVRYVRIWFGTDNIKIKINELVWSAPIYGEAE